MEKVAKKWRGGSKSEDNDGRLIVQKYNITSCFEQIKFFFTDDYFTKHTNITTIYKDN